MYTGLTLFQKNILDSDTKLQISWLFDIDKDGNGSIDYRWSTKAKSWGGNSYTFKVLPDFTPIRMQRGRSEVGIQAPSEFTFTISNKDNSLHPTDFDGGQVLVRLVVKAELTTGDEPGGDIDESGGVIHEGTNEGEGEIRSWRFQFTGVESDYQRMRFKCRDWLQAYLEGDYPNEAVISSLFVVKDDCCPDCASYIESVTSGSGHSHEESTEEDTTSAIVPLVFGTPMIPIRPIYVAAASKKRYLIGPDSPTYTLDRITTPPDWAGDAQEWLGSDHTFNQFTHEGEDGNDYKFAEFLVVDEDEDGTNDANIVFGEGNTYKAIPCKYSRDDTVNKTAPIDIIDHILQDWGISSSYIDATTKASAKAIHTTWGLEFHAGFWKQVPRRRLLSMLLTMCHTELIVRDKIYFKVHTKVSQHAVEKEWIIKKDDRTEGTFKYSMLSTPVTKDSGYVVHQTVNKCLGAYLLKYLIPAKSTTNNVSSTTIRADFIQTVEHAQKIGQLAIQRKLLPKASISFETKGKCLQIECDDVITINPADYGAGSGNEYDILVDSMEIRKDLSVKITATRFSDDLDDWGDLSPTPPATVTDGTTSMYSNVVRGPDALTSGGVYQGNLIQDRVRIGSSATKYILFDPVAVRISLGVGGDIFLQSGTGGNTALTIFDGDSRTYNMGTDFDTDTFVFYPDTTGLGSVAFGMNASAGFVRFDNINLFADNFIKLEAKVGSNEADITLNSTGIISLGTVKEGALGQINISGDLLPSPSEWYTFGNATKRWTQGFFSKAQITSLGGYAIELTNKTGANSIAGTVLTASTVANDAVKLSVSTETEALGIVLESSIANNAAMWAVVGGKADVAMKADTSATRGNWVFTSTEPGYADSLLPTPPKAGIPQLDQHMREIGHCVESVAAGTSGSHIVARCILQFN